MHIGIIYDKLISGACVVMDTDRYIEDNIRGLFTGLVRRMVMEYEIDKPSEEVSLINALCRRNKFDKIVYDKLKMKEKQIFQVIKGGSG